MAYGVSKAFDDVLSRRDKTTIRGVDSTERIFYISPYWMKEILIRNNGTNDVQIRLSEREKPITVKAGGELNLSGEFAYFFASAPAKQDIDILYRPTKKLIATKVPPILLYFDGEDDTVLVPPSQSLDVVDVTLEALIGEALRNPYSKIISRRFSNNFYFLGIDNGMPYGGIGDERSWTVVRSSKVLPLAYLYNIAFTFRDVENKANLYIDAELEIVANVPYSIGDLSNIKVSIGADMEGTFGFFHGTISLVRAYNRSLSNREIKHNNENLFEPVQRSLVLYLSPYSIDIVNGKWYDLSGQENHGTIYGAILKELWRPEQ